MCRRHGSILAVSGPTDIITDGTDVVRISNGHPHLTKVTGGGCALGAATAAATADCTVAAEIAVEGVRGTGAVAFLDALTGINDEMISSRMNIS